MWVILALSSSALFGVVTVIDKRLLDHHLPGVSVLYLWISIVLACYCLPIMVFSGVPEHNSIKYLLIALASGISIGIGLATMFVGLKSDEATRAIAITQTNPIVVSILAIMFLDETLNLGQWVSIGLVLVGTIMISLKKFSDHRILLPSRDTPVLLLSSIGLGTGFFLAKYALEGLTVWEVFSVQQLGVVLVFAVFALPNVWKNLVRVLRDKNTLLLMIFGEGVLPVIAIVLGLLASNLGPISLVSAILSTRPLFVFMISIFLNRSRWQLADEKLTNKELLMKGVSISLIITGIGALSSG